MTPTGLGAHQRPVDPHIHYTDCPGMWWEVREPKCSLTVCGSSPQVPQRQGFGSLISGFFRAADSYRRRFLATARTVLRQGGPGREEPACRVSCGHQRRSHTSEQAQGAGMTGSVTSSRAEAARMSWSPPHCPSVTQLRDVQGKGLSRGHPRLATSVGPLRGELSKASPSHPSQTEGRGGFSPASGHLPRLSQ